MAATAAAITTPPTDRAVLPGATSCALCGVLVAQRFTTSQRSITLDAEPVEGGLYRIDRHGRAERRSLVLLYAEARAGAQSAGYDPHECTGRAWYERD